MRLFHHTVASRTTILMKTIQPQIDVSCAVIEKDGLFLAAQRGEAMNMPLKWEFPGGKLEPELDQLLPEQRQQLATPIPSLANRPDWK